MFIYIGQRNKVNTIITFEQNLLPLKGKSKISKIPDLKQNINMSISFESYNLTQTINLEPLALLNTKYSLTNSRRKCLL